MLGQQVAQVLRSHAIPFQATDKELDFTNPQRVLSFAAELKPNWIVNCAAYTAVDRAEQEPEAARSLNVTGPENLAVAAAAVNARMIHISTDYVFGSSGGQTPLTEDDPVAPESVYGQTKLAGERAVLHHYPESVILRTSWLYGPHGNNFVYTMLRLFTEKPELSIVNDQYGTPTYAQDLAEAIRIVVSHPKPVSGIFHYSNQGQTTWFDFARKIRELAIQYGLLGPDNPCSLRPCTTREYPTPAKRPAWSVFSKDKIQRIYQVPVPTWQESLEIFIQQEAARKEPATHAPV